MELRRQILEHLGTPHADSRFGHAYLARTIADEAGCRPHLVWEAIWGLVGEGLVYLDPAGQGADNWQWRLSATGIQAISGGAWEPRDQEVISGASAATRRRSTPSPSPMSQKR
jgi:hypothetical protein